MNSFPAASIIALIMEREILRLCEAMSEGDRRFLAQYAFCLAAEYRGYRGADKRRTSGDMSADRFRRLLADASPVEIELIYRQARNLEKKKTAREGR